MSLAETLALQLNPRALTGEESGHIVVIEDVIDPDGRVYRLEYHATPDAKRAIAWCRSNPWSPQGPVGAGTDYLVSHIAPDGFVCLGNPCERALAKSPYGLDFAIRRARFWCTGFSAFMESGTFPTV